MAWKAPEQQYPGVEPFPDDANLRSATASWWKSAQALYRSTEFGLMGLPSPTELPDDWDPTKLDISRKIGLEYTIDSSLREWLVAGDGVEACGSQEMYERVARWAMTHYRPHGFGPHKWGTPPPEVLGRELWELANSQGAIELRAQRSATHPK